MINTGILIITIFIFCEVCIFYVVVYLEKKGYFLKSDNLNEKEDYIRYSDVIKNQLLNIEKNIKEFRPDFKLHNCKYINNYVKQITGIYPSKYYKEIIDNYIEYKNCIIETANNILDDFYENSKLFDEMIFCDFTTEEIGDYVYEKTRIDLKEFTKHWVYEPSYHKFKLKYVLLARDILAEKPVNSIKKKKEKIEKQVEYNIFEDMNTTEIVAFVKKSTCWNIQNIVYQKFGHPRHYSEYKRLIIETAILQLNNPSKNFNPNVKPNVKIIDNKISDDKSIVPVLKNNTAPGIDSEHIDKLPDHLQILKDDLDNSIDEHWKNIKFKQEQIFEDRLQALLKIEIKEKECILKKKYIDYKLYYKQAEKIYLDCIQTTNFIPITKVITKNKNKKLLAVKQQKFELAANSRELERTYQLLLMQLYKYNDSDSDSEKISFNDVNTLKLLQKFSEKDLIRIINECLNFNQ
jgi:hypothetical protein